MLWFIYFLKHDANHEQQHGELFFRRDEQYFYEIDNYKKKHGRSVEIKEVHLIFIWKEITQFYFKNDIFLGLNFFYIFKFIIIISKFQCV